MANGQRAGLQTVLLPLGSHGDHLAGAQGVQPGGQPVDVHARHGVSPNLSSGDGQGAILADDTNDPGAANAPVSNIDPGTANAPVGVKRRSRRQAAPTRQRRGE
ncbi:protein of unknown function [Rhodovastum atsumiense]|nr:protein of unknown function [Rhodovastum atsumiense]